VCNNKIPSNCFLYKGITNLNDDVNPYLMFLIAAIAEIIGTALCHLNDIFGRKRMMVLFTLSAGVVCLVVALLPTVPSKENGALSWSSVLNIIFASLGKVMASAAFNSFYILNYQLYPTNVRTTAVLFTSNIGRIGSYISPQVNSLQTLVWKPLPYIIFSSFSFFASGCVLILPDPEKMKIFLD
jgi:MFS family permease